MIKVAALLLVTISLAHAANLQSTHFDGLKTFLHGFANGYEGKNTTHSDGCLTATLQSKLDEDVVLILSSLVRADFEDVFTYINVFFTDLETMSTDCGLGIVLSSFQLELKIGGAFVFVKNLAFNFYKVFTEAKDMISPLFSENWLVAGEHFGAMVDLIIPMQS